MATTEFTFERARTVEWMTVVLTLVVYAVLALLVWFHNILPWWVILPIGSYTAALHSSLQHETLHGHPTRNRMLNEALIFITPTFWLPYGCYRDTHLAHHNDQHLTDPERDPESYYMLPEQWAAMPGTKRTLFVINQTLGGRMLIGPAVSIVQFWVREWSQILRGDLRSLSCWIAFAISAALAFYYVSFVCQMPFWKYYFLVAYPGISLALVRSYCEHQAAENIGERTIIVEASPFWSLLFLNNNLHIAHHARPTLPWYALPAYYRAERDAFINRNKNYVMRGYGQIFRQYLFVPKEPIPHPNLRWLRS